MELIEKYFQPLTLTQINQFNQLEHIYREWNLKINVISRKDIDNLNLHHVLHSLAIAKIIEFSPGSHILDAGTGGGFPGIPLAILFPQVKFTLADSIAKKIKVTEAVKNELKLDNCTVINERIEKINQEFDFIVCRAVTGLTELIHWVKGKINPRKINSVPNGIFYLKGGDLTAELGKIKQKNKIYNISEFFREEFFATKKIVYVNLS